jgi:hypothetical protein
MADEAHRTDDAGPAPSVLRARRVLRLVAFVLAVVLGTAVGGVAAWIVVVAWRYDPSPPIRRRELVEAQRMWHDAGPGSYDLVVRVTGPQEATYAVEVRGGEVLRATRNDYPLTQRRTFDTWTVPGMFATIEEDIKNMEKVAEGTAEPQTPHVTVRGAFDPQYGYPAWYHRIESTEQQQGSWAHRIGQPGAMQSGSAETGVEMTFRVTQFTIVEP